MNDPLSLQDVFENLKSIMNQYDDGLVCVKDLPGDYYLDTKHRMKNKKPLFFGAVQIKKKYVSYHLMPTYVFPELLEGISPELKDHMQGKSCFNFKSFDDEIFNELSRLTEAGYIRYREAGYI